MLFSQCFDEIIFRRKYRGCSYQNHKHLAGFSSGADQNVTQQTIAAVLIVNLDLKGLCQFPDRLDHLIRFLILNLTDIDRHQTVASFFVSSDGNIAGTHMLICRMYLVPVIIWIVHSHDRFRFSKIF